MTRYHVKRPHYLRVLPDAPPRAAQARSVAPMPPGPPEGLDAALEHQRRPPRRPKRPTPAVRKSLRVALAGAAGMLEHLDDADPRFPQRADKVASALVAYASKLTALATELKLALHCERQRDLWRKGKPYAE